MLSLSLLLGKLCLLTVYHRFFAHIDHVRHQIYWTGALCFPLLVGCVILPILTSITQVKSERTHDSRFTACSSVSMAIGVGSIIIDLIILYIPIPSIIGMNLSRKKKGGVLVIFLTGLMYVILCKIRHMGLIIAQSGHCGCGGHVLPGSTIKASGSITGWDDGWFV